MQDSNYHGQKINQADVALLQVCECSFGWSFCELLLGAEIQLLLMHEGGK